MFCLEITQVKRSNFVQKERGVTKAGNYSLNGQLLQMAGVSWYWCDKWHHEL